MRSDRAAFVVLASLASIGAAACGSGAMQGMQSGAGGGTSGTTASTVSTASAGGRGGAAGAGGAGGGGAGGKATSVTTGQAGAPADAGSDVDNGMPSTMYPAPHPPPPQIQNFAGPVLAAPKMYPVYFPSNDPAVAALITDFTKQIGQAPYWTTVVTEYGGGPGTGEAPIQLTEAAPATIDDSGIQAWLAAKFNTADPAFPVPDANTLIMLYYPPGTTVTLQGNQGCQSFGGYHSSVAINDPSVGAVAYAVIPDCGGGIDQVTSTASHEMMEATTDPQPQTNTAWGQVDGEHIYWELALSGGEVGDMCAQNSGAFTKFPPMNYVVQRGWSNASILAGHDPCVPKLYGEVYFNSPPVLPDMVPFYVNGQPFTVHGVNVPTGGTRTIDLDLYSEGDTGGPWQVDVQDESSSRGGPQLLDLSLDRTQGVNGEKLHLTIKVLQAGQGSAELFYVTSTLGAQTSLWVGLVKS